MKATMQAAMAAILVAGCALAHADDSPPPTPPATTQLPKMIVKDSADEGYAVVDAQAAYDFDRFTVEFSGVNLAGRRAFDPYEYLGFPVVMPNQPRSAYVTLKARY